MRWTISLEEKDLPEVAEAIQYCKDFLAGFDTTKLDWVRIDNGRKNYNSFYGRCWYPEKGRKKDKKQYRVSCQINSSLMRIIERDGVYMRPQRRSPIYKVKSGVAQHDFEDRIQEAEANEHITLGDMQSMRGSVWVRVYEEVPYYSFAECIISIFGHEIGHFLSRTKQIQVKNTEIEIDKFEDKFLEDYRKWKKVPESLMQ